MFAVVFSNPEGTVWRRLELMMILSCSVVIYLFPRVAALLARGSPRMASRRDGKGHLHLNTTAELKSQLPDDCSG